MSDGQGPMAGGQGPGAGDRIVASVAPRAARSGRPVTLHDRAAAAVADTGLRAALEVATGRLAGGRRTAMAAFPEAEALRDHARRIRAHTLSRLDTYLARFATAARRAGARVVAAETGADATRYVTDLARARGVRLAVKAKSMVSEEVGLNAALEAAGIRVLETDLGEFIVQVAHDHPSHIVAPVVHRSRANIAELLKRELGATDEEVADVPAITALVRGILRGRFLDADLGVSGANFAVAETGSIVTVTNEGNGRLSTTAPPIHVVLVGIERVIPTAADLGVMLQLLARSATGQKLSVYTNVVTGPRGRGAASEDAGLAVEADGPDELHVVLVDNGRSRLLAGPLAEILYCIRCGACLNACPVYRQIGGHAYDAIYSGPVGSVLTPGVEGAAARHEMPHASTLCGACREVCPVRIDIPRLLLLLRADAGSRRQAPPWLRAGVGALGSVAARPAWYRAATRAARTATAILARDGWVRRLPGPLGGWTGSRDFPAFARKSFVEQWASRRHRAGAGGGPAAADAPRHDGGSGGWTRGAGPGPRGPRRDE
jgi:L-lactate dehydrogenase complex protein LldF